MRLTWLDPEHLDPRDVAETVALLEAARAVDRPDRIRPTVTSFTADVRHGWDGDPPLYALARDGTGRAFGVIALSLPHWDNTHVASLLVRIDPVRRRQGLGRRLFEIGLERLRAEGRRVVLSESTEDPAGIAFLKGMGFQPALEAVKRRQDLTAVDWPRLDEEYAGAEPHAAGYELVRVPLPTPDELLVDVARMTEAINDAPLGDLDIEDAVFGPERIRAFEAAQQARNFRGYRLVAKERGTGVLAGHTMVYVDSDCPWQGHQYDTSVRSGHRGHRLGLLLKTAMLRWLRDEEPQLRVIDTSNAASNEHMIRVNETMGYHIVLKTIEWQRRL